MADIVKSPSSTIRLRCLGVDAFCTLPGPEIGLDHGKGLAYKLNASKRSPNIDNSLFGHRKRAFADASVEKWQTAELLEKKECVSVTRKSIKHCRLKLKLKLTKAVFTHGGADSFDLPKYTQSTINILSRNIGTHSSENNRAALHSSC